MQALLGTLNSMPGVLGSMVCDAEGRVRAQAFPAPFEAATLQEMASVLTDGAIGLETVAGWIDLIDLRFGESRMVVKPMVGGLVALLCGRSVNVPLLGISISVATKKLEKLLASPEQADPPRLERQAAPAEQGAVPLEAEAFASTPAPAPLDAASDQAPEEAADGKKRKKSKTTWFPSV